MRRYWLLVAGMLGAFLALFGAVQALGIDVLTDPGSVLGRGGIAGALAGVALLVADVFLPVPSSVVMVANGALFGAAAGGALSLAGSVGAAALAFALGRRGARLVERIASPAGKAAADELLRRWGALAVVVTRPVPLLAETTALLAGASPRTWRRLLAASAAGAAPPSLLYALAGATRQSLGGELAIFAAVIAAAGVAWALGRRASRRRPTVVGRPEALAPHRQDLD
jgi:3-dehydroquinate synthase